MLQDDGRNNQEQRRAGFTPDVSDKKIDRGGFAHTIMSSWPELDMTCACATVSLPSRGIGPLHLHSRTLTMLQMAFAMGNYNDFTKAPSLVSIWVA
jgi:hypothetical protein